MKMFVVDENVVMEAIENKKPNGDLALPEVQFMVKLLRSGDPLFVNEAILKKYRGIEQKIEMRSRSEGLNNGIHKAFMQTLSDAARVTRIDGVPVDWDGLKKCDKEFVAVALQSCSILVTSDVRLRETVEGHPESRIECTTAECALGLVGAQD